MKYLLSTLHKLPKRTVSRSAAPKPTRYDVPSNRMHGSYHWQMERLLSVSLLPLVSYPMVFGPSKGVDFLLGIAIPLHCHLGRLNDLI
jgi:succinate dehydrogenase (ubiquinone) membrane anchor subunit